MNKQSEIKPPPLAVGLPETARLLGIPKSLAYKLANTGEIPTIKTGERCRIVPMKAIEKLISQWE